LGSLFAVIFFITLMVAALTSAISLLEVVTAFLNEQFAIRRGVAVSMAVAVIGVLGCVCSLSQGHLRDLTLGGRNIFDLMDYLSSNILLPLGGLLIVLFTGWRMPRDDFRDELSNSGLLRVSALGAIRFMLRWVIPVAIGAILVTGLI
jgi:NSS family neurotransmitter:Na+ symporter